MEASSRKSLDTLTAATFCGGRFSWPSQSAIEQPAWLHDQHAAGEMRAEEDLAHTPPLPRKEELP
jgi:hypothetical protein